MKRSFFALRVEVHTGGSEALDGELQLLSYRQNTDYRLQWGLDLPSLSSGSVLLDHSLFELSSPRQGETTYGCTVRNLIDTQ